MWLHDELYLLFPLIIFIIIIIIVRSTVLCWVVISLKVAG